MDLVLEVFKFVGQLRFLWGASGGDDSSVELAELVLRVHDMLLHLLNCPLHIYRCRESTIALRIRGTWDDIGSWLEINRERRGTMKDIGRHTRRGEHVARGGMSERWALESLGLVGTNLGLRL